MDETTWRVWHKDGESDPPSCVPSSTSTGQTNSSPIRVTSSPSRVGSSPSRVASSPSIVPSLPSTTRESSLLWTKAANCSTQGDGDMKVVTNEQQNNNTNESRMKARKQKKKERPSVESTLTLIQCQEEEIFFFTFGHMVLYKIQKLGSNLKLKANEVPKKGWI